MLRCVLSLRSGSVRKAGKGARTRGSSLGAINKNNRVSAALMESLLLPGEGRGTLLPG